MSVRRMIEPESVFGQLKNNRGFRRFLLRGLPKVSLKSRGFHSPITCSRKRQSTERQK
nr:transposase [Paenibacillus pinisoli]